MTTVPGTIAIIGASLAGARAAEALRLKGYQEKILLIGEERLRPYERPSLSKSALLEGEGPEPQWVHAADYYSTHDIDLITGNAVTHLQPGTRSTLKLASGETLQADAVLLSTGGRARRLKGTEGLERVHYVRDWADAMRLRPALRPGAKVVVIGSGFIGAEIAASAATAGCLVDMIEALPVPFAAIANRLVRASVAAAHRAAGVCIHPGLAIDAVIETQQGIQVSTTSGQCFEADVVVVGIGMEPRTELARMAGATIDRGILIDGRYRTTVPGLYAAGDVATMVDAAGNKHRAEHWRSAQEQGAGAAVAMLGAEPPALTLPWCWSDQYSHRLEVAGSPRADDRQIVRSTGETEHCAFHLRDGVLVGVTGFNAPRLVRAAMSLISKGARPDPAQLGDTGRPLNKVELLDTVAT